jgi:hypothetical protein
VACRSKTPRYFIGSADEAYIRAAEAASVCLFGGGKRALVDDLTVGDCILYFAPDSSHPPDGAFISAAHVTGPVQSHTFADFKFSAWVRAAEYDVVNSVSLHCAGSSGGLNTDLAPGHHPRIEIDQNTFLAVSVLMGLKHND